MIAQTSTDGRIPNARRYLNGMTRICYGSGLLIAALIYVLPVSGQAQQAGIYNVAGIQVDRTAYTAATARQEAIVEAHRRAFDRLMARIVPADRIDLRLAAYGGLFGADVPDIGQIADR